MTDLIIGTGPAGVSAAVALLARGRQVVMIDAGHSLEVERESMRAGMALVEPADWRADQLAQYRAALPGVPAGSITRFGSDYLVRDPEGLVEGTPPWLGLRPSYATGGLSNGWGAAVLPYRQEDLTGWPITADDLAPHYKAVSDFMPVSGVSDDLAGLFPAQDVSALRPLKLSAQAEGLLSRLARRREALRDVGIAYGRSRIAVDGDCKHCGLCLVGCPFRYIFNANRLVREMAGNPNVTLRSPLRALSFSETAGGVSVVCRDVGGSTEVVHGERLFIAGGVLPTTQLMLASARPAPREVIMLDSQQMLMPMVHAWSSLRDPVSEPRHALTQIFIELNDARLSPNLIHGQLYTYTELFAAEMRGRYGRIPLSGPLFDALSRRLVVAQLFLHSDHSHRIGLSLAADGVRLSARLLINPDTDRLMKRARDRFALAMLSVGLGALIPLARMGLPGASFHCGGAFQMAHRPLAGQADTLGRPSGLSRVHLVDATVLPSVPATTITFSVMANAHRIASLAPVP